MSDVCEFENHPDEGGMYWCYLPDGHDGKHQCTSVCGFPDPDYPPQKERASE